MHELTPELIAVIAARFKALGEPARLRILSALRDGERTVGEIESLTGLSQANVSRHLRVLHELRFVKRRKEKLYVYYSLRGEDVFQLCDLMCVRVEEEVRDSARVVQGRTNA